MTVGEKADAEADAEAEAKEEEEEEEEEEEPQKLVAVEVPENETASWGHPAFALGFPRQPELDALVAAFASGDYGTVRTRAPELAANPDVSDEVKRAALLLRARVEPDKTSRMFFALAAALLVFLTLWWVTHDGPEHHAPAPAPVPPTVEFVK
jgi:hypothetical protein